MISKNGFEYDEPVKEWYYLLYTLNDYQYNNVDFSVLSNIIQFSEDNSESLEKISQKAIMDYAKYLNVFTKEEYDDLVFEYIDTVFEDKDGIVETFTRTYTVDEDEETTKIFWKDVYGVWKVTFKGFDVVKVVREYS